MSLPAEGTETKLSSKHLGKAHNLAACPYPQRVLKLGEKLAEQGVAVLAACPYPQRVLKQQEIALADRLAEPCSMSLPAEGTETAG